MAVTTGPPQWKGLTVALLLGTTMMATLAFFATLLQPPGLEGPVEVVPVSVVVAVLGVTALPLVWWGDRWGYGTAGAAGTAAVAGMALYFTGAFGPPRPAPAAYLFLLLGSALVVSTVVAWRHRSPEADGS